MKTRVITSVAALAGLGAVATFVAMSTSVFAQKQPAPPASVISPVRAMQIATAKAGGHALSATFEFDEGHWVYGVIVVSGPTLQEVELDPATGKVGDVEKITPEGEAKEMAGELNKAIGKAPAKGTKEENDEKPKKTTGGGF